MRKIIAVFAAAILLMGGYYLYNRYSVGGNVDTAAQAQSTAKKGLALQSIAMPQAGFLVIQQENNGQPGNVLGTSNLLKSGDNQNVQISAQLNPGQKYFVTAYADSDKSKTFSQKKDKPMKDKSGKVMQQEITAPNS